MWPFPSRGDLPNPGIEATSPALQADSLPGKPINNNSIISITKSLFNMINNHEEGKVPGKYKDQQVILCRDYKNSVPRREMSKTSLSYSHNDLGQYLPSSTTPGSGRSFEPRPWSKGEDHCWVAALASEVTHQGRHALTWAGRQTQTLLFSVSTTEKANDLFHGVQLLTSQQCYHQKSQLTHRLQLSLIFLPTPPNLYTTNRVG